MKVWTYWEGPMPTYIEVCIKSMEKACSDYAWLSDYNVSGFLPPDVLHPNWKKLPQAALRADCVRAGLLAIHGGFWCDADTVGIKDPNLLLEQYDNPNILYCTWTKPPVRILNGYIYFWHANYAALTWLEQINQALAGDITKIDWCSLGEGLLTKLIPTQARAIKIPRDTFLPIDIDLEVPVFFSDQDFNKYITENTVCFGLNHSWFWYHKRPLMEQWKESKGLIFDLLRSVM